MPLMALRDDPIQRCARDIVLGLLGEVERRREC
jgi:hypothetical protein